MPRTATPEQYLVPVGSTVRHVVPDAGAKSLHAALLVGDTLTSHFWLNILSLCRDARVRYFLTESDLQLVSERLHVRPELLPCFLVFVGGYLVDWFPAPLPPASCAVDPMELLAKVCQQLQTYQ